MRYLAFILILLSALPASAQECVDDKLVNACRIWFGANVRQYKEAGKGIRNQVEYFEERLGRRVDVVHVYHGIGDNRLSETDVHFIARPGTLLMANWKPARRWSEAAGGNAGINAGIDEMARSIKKVAPKKIFLAVYHEPEDQVEDGTSCPSYSNKEKAGTPADYRAMWKNVRRRFDALEVDNVVWVMNYMGYDRWNCMVNDLWPGNGLVDWVVWDSYAHESQPWPDAPLNLYRFLTENSTAEHDYLSKPWGLNEFGVWGTQDFVLSQYEAMVRALEGNVMPRLKLYAVFDNGDSRVGYTQAGEPAPEEQAAFNRFANHPRFTAPQAR